MSDKERKARKYKNVFKAVKKQFDIRLLSEKFESQEKARVERKSRIKLLLKTGVTGDKAKAKTLRGCRKNRRCWNGACPVCVRKYRIRHCAVLLKLCKDPSQVKILTLIPALYLMSPEELKNFSVRNFCMMLRAQLKRLGLSSLYAVGGCELAFCEKTRMWIPHFHIAAIGLTPVAIKTLRKVYKKQNKERRISKPVLVQELKNPAKQLSYTYKSFATCKRNPDEKYLPYKGKVRISEPYHTQSIRFFAEHEPQNFEFLYGYTQRGAKVYHTRKKIWEALNF